MAFPTSAVGGEFIGVQGIQKINDHFADALQHTSAAPVATNVQTTTAYTLVLADAGKAIEMNVAEANTVTIPLNASVAFPIGTVIEVCQIGAGQTTILKEVGVLLRIPSPLTGALRAQYSSVSLRKRTSDQWVVAGDLS